MEVQRNLSYYCSQCTLIDWLSEAYNINNDVVIKVDDFRVRNDDTDQMFYSINGNKCSF